MLNAITNGYATASATVYSNGFVSIAGKVEAVMAL
jgi:hypothetical protein